MNEVSRSSRVIVRGFTPLTQEERKFLLTIKQANPEWNLLNIAGIENLPALKWKLINIKNMDKHKYQESLKKLKRALKL